jgi:tRNA U34 5-carboxymethylaminomethyl modifying GTPase MnmE/TrmE
MNKSDLKAIKDVVDSALETHLASVHEEITDMRNELKRDLSKAEAALTAKIDYVDEKLGGFENREVDKRLQLEVRVDRLEKQRS